MSAFRDGARVVLATGDERTAEYVFDDGAINCPWCGGAWGADEATCPNPACLASRWADEASVRETFAAWDAERQRREKNGRLVASLQRQREAEQAAEAEAWVAMRDEAEARGACLPCLQKSSWRSGRPRYVRHRRADFHESGA